MSIFRTYLYNLITSHLTRIAETAPQPVNSTLAETPINFKEVQAMKNLIPMILSISLISFIIGCDNGREKINESQKESAIQRTEQALPKKTVEYYTEDEVLQARKKFKIDVVEFDAKQEYGTEFPYSDRVRLKITNNSDIVLPYLTTLTKRLDRQGKMIGSSRAPSIPTSNIKPGESFEYEYCPKGHLPGVEKINVDIEHIIDDESKKFFKELNMRIPKQK